MLRVRRKKGGALTVSLPHQEALVLRQLPARLRELLERPDFGSRLIQRLFPPAYQQDEAREEEYRRLLGDDLLSRKLECLRSFESSFKRSKASKKTVEITVEPEGFELWLGFVNDMRLVLGAALDIQEDSWKEPFDPDHPRALDMALYHYLTWLEGELLGAKGFHDPKPKPPAAGGQA